MKKIISLITILITFVASYGQLDKDSILIAKIVKSGISIGKSFNGTSADETQPANFFWYKDLNDNYYYSLIDLGIKYQPKFISSKKSDLIISPKSEWHKNGDTTLNSKNNKNTLSAGLNIQYIYMLKQIFWPIILLSSTYNKDYIKKIETLNLSSFLSLTSTKKYCPGSMKVRNRNYTRILFRYYIYLGYEYYQSIKTSDISSAYFVPKISMELSPFTKSNQITLNYAYRFASIDKLYNQGNISWLTLGFNHYFDKSKSIGIGFDYSTGYDPSNNFIKTSKIDLGLKLKIGKQPLPK